PFPAVRRENPAHSLVMDVRKLLLPGESQPRSYARHRADASKRHCFNELTHQSIPNNARKRVGPIASQSETAASDGGLVGSNFTSSGRTSTPPRFSFGGARKCRPSPGRFGVVRTS